MEPSSRSGVIAVAVLFLLGGLVEIGSLLTGLNQGFGPVLFGGISIATGIGLLRRSEGWRKFALVALTLELSGTIGLAAFLFTPQRSPLRVGWPGHSFALNTVLAATFLVVLLSVELLSAWALTRRSAKAMFVPSN